MVPEIANLVYGDRLREMEFTNAATEKGEKRYDHII